MAAGLVFGATNPPSMHAQDRVWQGAGASSGWSVSANWQGALFPLPGDGLAFPAGAGRLANNNDYAPPIAFHRIIISGAGYSITGNAIGLSNGLSATFAGSSTLSLPVTLLANQTFTVLQSATLHLGRNIQMGEFNLGFTVVGSAIVNANISGATTAQLRKQSTGVLWMRAGAGYLGPTLVDGGVLRADGRLTNTFITINPGGTLSGTGQLSAFRATGGIVQPGFDTPGILFVSGNVALPAGSAFSVRLNGTNVGVNYDRLSVAGGVTLGGSLNVNIGFTPAVGTIFTIIANGGADSVTNTFASLPEGAVLMAEGRPFRISYRGGTGNDVTLEALPAVVNWDGGGLADNRWSLPRNWVGDFVPTNSDTLQFINTNSAVLVTRNDLPAARFFSSLLFGRGDHRLEGNTIDVRGRIEITESNTVNILAPLTLRGGVRNSAPSGYLQLFGAIRLSSNQTFVVENNASVSVHNGLDLGGNQLRVDAVSNLSSLHVFGSILSPGTLVKVGSGAFHLWGTNGVATSVDEGFLVIRPRGLASGPITVNTGATLVAQGTFRDLELRFQGTFAANTDYGRPTALGTVRLLAGSTFRVDGGLAASSNGLTALGPVALAGDLLVTLTGDPVADLRVVIIDNQGAGPITGTFNGLPEGATVMIEGAPFRLSYVGGDGNDVELVRVPLPPASLSPAVQFSEEQVTLRGQGIDGARYWLESTTNLAPPIVWTSREILGTSNGVFEFIQPRDPSGSLPRRQFYRIISR